MCPTLPTLLGAGTQLEMCHALQRGMGPTGAKPRGATKKVDEVHMLAFLLLHRV